MERGLWAVKRWGYCEAQITVRLPSEIKQELLKVAKEKGLTLSDLIRLYIEKGLVEGWDREIMLGNK
jgi:predicted DNA-binding protein